VTHTTKNDDTYLKMNSCFVDALKNGCNLELFFLVICNPPAYPFITESRQVAKSVLQGPERPHIRQSFRQGMSKDIILFELGRTLLLVAVR
jgi:hypothetical protein